MNEPAGADFERAVLDGPEQGKGHRLAVKIFIPLFILLVTTVFVLYIFYSTAVVDGSSMYPTLHDTDYLLVTHGEANLKRGDIVVTNVLEGQQPIELVKRVIGMPGDVIEIRDDVAYVNGQREPNRGQVIVPELSESRLPITVPSGSMYVMGDNRSVSEDSRHLGPVPVSGLKGRAASIFAPINRIRLLP